MKIDTSTWTEAQRTEYMKRVASIDDAKSKTELAKAKREAERLSPDGVLAALAAEQYAEELAAANEAHAMAVEVAQRAADLVYRTAAAKYGDARVARVYAHEGSVIFRPSTMAEMDDLGLRLSTLASPQERSTVVRESLVECVIYPPREAFNAMVEKWPGLWEPLFAARDTIAGKEIERVEKKG